MYTCFMIVLSSPFDTCLLITGTLRACACQRERLHLSSHTGLIQVLPGHALADQKYDQR